MDLLGISAQPNRVSKKKDAQPITASNLIKTIKARLKHLGFSRNSNIFEPPEYDLSEIGRAQDVESLVNTSFDKHLTMCLKEGFTISSKDNEIISYLRRRIRRIEMATQTAWDHIVRETMHNLIIYSNAFIVKVRSERVPEASSLTTTRGRRLNPIAGYFPVDPTTMLVRRDKHGRVLRWEQKVDGNDTVEFRPEDVVHFHYNKKTGFAFGTPWILPALDDIRLLRRLEENIDLLMVQYLFPLYHYTVGTDENPAMDEEIEAVNTRVGEMPTEGALVTSHRHKIEAVGAQNKAIRAEAYLEHFYMRVLGGLNLSTVDLGSGDTSNRNTSETMNKNRQEKCKDFQIQFSSFMNILVINELLEEGGYPTFNDQGLPTATWHFNEIDIDLQIKKENQAIYKYEHHATTEDEMRLSIGEDIIEAEEDRKKMYLNTVSIPQIKAEAEARAASGMANTPGGTTGSAKKAGATKAPTRKNSAITERMGADKMASIIGEVWEITKEDVLHAVADSEGEAALDIIFKISTDALVPKISHFINAAVISASDTDVSNTEITDTAIKMQKFAHASLASLFGNVQDKVYNILQGSTTENKKSSVIGVFDALEYKIANVTEKIIEKAYEAGAKIG
jgi:hypothetical protein